jgi:hypothetical protein
MTKTKSTKTLKTTEPLLYMGIPVPEVFRKKIQELGWNDPEVQGLLASWEEMGFPEVS